MSAIKANKRNRRMSRLTPNSKGSSTRKSDSGRRGSKSSGRRSSKSGSTKEINSFSEQLRQYRETSSKEHEKETSDSGDENTGIAAPFIKVEGATPTQVEEKK